MKTKFNGDVLATCPKTQVRNIVLSEGSTVAKMRDKTKFEYDFKLDGGRWSVVMIKIFENKRRFNDGRKQRSSKRSF